MKITHNFTPDWLTRLIVFHDGHHTFEFHHMEHNGKHTNHRIINYDENGDDIGATCYYTGYNFHTVEDGEIFDKIKEGREKDIFIALVKMMTEEDITFGHIQIFDNHVRGYTHDTQDEIWSNPITDPIGKIQMNVRMS